ncbi:hypothetical protein ACFL12_00620 [Pseudomonadota bacterium]
MAENPKAAWPKTPDGTTDWEVVFEDPTSGFIPLIVQAQSAEALKMSATVIIEKLFTRRNDTDQRELMIARLGELVKEHGANMDTTRTVVADLMREIKDERVEKARVYVERKRAGASIDRRAGLWWKIDRFLSPKVLLPIGGVFVLMLSAIVYFALQSTLGPSTDVAGQEGVEGDGKAPKVVLPDEFPGDETITPTPEVVPIPIYLKTIRWPLTSTSDDRPRYYGVVLYVKQWDHRTEVCRRKVKVMDRIYLTLNDTLPQVRQPRAKEMRAFEEELAKDINAMMGGTYVTEVIMARYGTREFRVSTKPPYCQTPNDYKRQTRSAR